MDRILLPENLVFLIPLCAAVAWFFMGLLLGAMHHGDGDADGDVHVDGDHDLHIDGDHDLHIDGDAHDVHLDGEAHDLHPDGEVHGDVSLGAALSFVGFGKIPVVLWLQILCILWGLLGIGSVYGGLGWISYVVAGVGALVGVTGISRGLARVLPKRMESDLVPRDQRIGMLGVVCSTRVDAERGEGRFSTPKGLVYIPIRTEDGGSLDELTKIIIMDIKDNGVAIVKPEERLLLDE